MKLALLFLYRRIFEHTRFLLMINGMIAFVAVWVTLMTFLAIFNCNPISAFWTQEGTCLDFKEFAIGYAIVNIVTDFTVWLMPIPSAWKIQLPTPQKIALSLIFALGLLYENLVLCPGPGRNRKVADCQPCAVTVPPRWHDFFSQCSYLASMTPHGSIPRDICGP